MNNNLNKKNKFVENVQRDILYPKDNTFCVQDTIKNNYNTKSKSQFELNKELDPFNYDVNYKNTIRKDIKGSEEFIYYSPYDQGPGRGFGNLNVNNIIRNSDSSRKDTTNFFSELNRHKVMHGLTSDYGNEINSLKALSLLCCFHL